VATVTRTPAVTQVVEPEKFVIELTRQEARELRDVLAKASGSFSVFAKLDDLIDE
jgi:hypothetical protein